MKKKKDESVWYELLVIAVGTFLIMFFKTLNIAGVLLDKSQLYAHMKKIASDHNIKINSDKNTYPIYSLNENYKFILETYELLNQHIKLGIKIHSAG